MGQVLGYKDLHVLRFLVYLPSMTLSRHSQFFFYFLQAFLSWKAAEQLALTHLGSLERILLPAHVVGSWESTA